MAVVFLQWLAAARLQNHVFAKIECNSKWYASVSSVMYMIGVWNPQPAGLQKISHGICDSRFPKYNKTHHFVFKTQVTDTFIVYQNWTVLNKFQTTLLILYTMRNKSARSQTTCWKYNFLFKLQASYPGLPVHSYNVFSTHHHINQQSMNQEYTHQLYCCLFLVWQSIDLLWCQTQYLN